jgi:O-antigen/teichoic acid export membrane protein
MIAPAIRKIRQLLLPRDPTKLDDHTRGAERNRRAVLTSIVAMLAKVVQIASWLITVRLTLEYLGIERFGLWMAISAVLAMAAFADFGVGLGVLNTVAKAYGKDDIEGIRKAVSSGFATLNVIAALLLLSFFAIYRFVNWADFFRVVSPLARSEAGPALTVFAICFALNIAMDVVQRVQLGLQQGYHYSIWQLCGSIIGLVGVLAGIRLHVSLPMLVAAVAGGPVVATALNGIHFFGFVRPDLRPSRKFASREVSWQIARLGGLFFVIQIVLAVSFSVDNFVIARTLGAVTVPDFAVPQRMFSVIAVVTSLLLTPLWPAYGEAISRGDMTWVRRTLSRTIFGILALTSVASAVLVVLSNRILLLWVGPSIHPPFMLILGLAVWAVLQCVTGTIQSFLNGAGIMRFQVGIFCVFGVVCLAAKVWSVRRYGIVALPWATVITYGLLVILPYVWYVPYLIERMTAKAPGLRLPATIEQPRTLVS